MNGRRAHGVTPRGQGVRKQGVSGADELWFVTNDQDSHLPQRSGSFQAMVRAGNSVTAYLRTGKGEPVILLRRAHHADALWGLILSEVSHSFRAIVPEHAPTGEEFATWFRSFLDGLGLTAISVVADAHFAIRCAQSGLLDAEWLTVLVVVSSIAERDVVAEALRTPAGETVNAAIVVDDAESPHAVATTAVNHLKSLRASLG